MSTEVRSIQQVIWSKKLKRPIMVRVEVMVDFDKIAEHMAGKAVHTKSGKATALFGAIKVIHDGNWRGAREGDAP